MLKYQLRTAILMTLVSSSALAQAGPFQYSCSNIGFGIDDNQPALTAVCRTDDGKFKPAFLILQGISNVNGSLTQGEGKSTFQETCGNMQVLVDGPYVSLSAICRTEKGEYGSTSLSLTGITNNDGKLSAP